MFPILGIMASQISGHLTAPSDYESIATVTPSGAASISFTSIAADWKHLQIRGIAREGAGGITDIAYADIRFNSDAGSNYFRHYLTGNGASPSSSAETPRTSGKFAFAGSAVAASIFATNVVDILDYTSTNKTKTVRTLFGEDNNGSGTVGLMSFAWNNTAAITRIDIISPNSNWATGSSFALYGIKG